MGLVIRVWAKPRLIVLLRPSLNFRMRRISRYLILASCSVLAICLLWKEYINAGVEPFLLNRIRRLKKSHGKPQIHFWHMIFGKEFVQYVGLQNVCKNFLASYV
jgi:hypothetical protein